MKAGARTRIRRSSYVVICGGIECCVAIVLRGAAGTPCGRRPCGLRMTHGLSRPALFFKSLPDRPPRAAPSDHAPRPSMVVKSLCAPVFRSITGISVFPSMAANIRCVRRSKRKTRFRSQKAMHCHGGCVTSSPIAIQSRAAVLLYYYHCRPRAWNLPANPPRLKGTAIITKNADSTPRTAGLNNLTLRSAARIVACASHHQVIHGYSAQHQDIGCGIQ